MKCIASIVANTVFDNYHNKIRWYELLHLPPWRLLYPMATGRVEPCSYSGAGFVSRLDRSGIMVSPHQTVPGLRYGQTASSHMCLKINQIG